MDLIKWFGNILSAMANGHSINKDTFQKYGIETTKLFMHLYPWFYMPQSMYDVLIHSVDVIHYTNLLVIFRIIFSKLLSKLKLLNYFLLRRIIQ